jgi:hypothetical protein
MNKTPAKNPFSRPRCSKIRFFAGRARSRASTHAGDWGRALCAPTRSNNFLGQALRVRARIDRSIAVRAQETA